MASNPSQYPGSTPSTPLPRTRGALRTRVRLYKIEAPPKHAPGLRHPKRAHAQILYRRARRSLRAEKQALSDANNRDMSILPAFAAFPFSNLLLKFSNFIFCGLRFF